MPRLALEPLQELKDDHLHRHVKRGGRLVEHQQVRLDGNGAGNADAGALTARELMREARQQFERQAALACHLLHALRQLLAAKLAQPAQRIGNGRKRGKARVDAVAGILKHHLDAGAIAVAGEYPRGFQRQIAVAEHDAAAAGIDQARQCANERRLAAAGFADQPHRFALTDAKADIVDGVHFRYRLDAAGQTPLQPRKASWAAADREQFEQLGDFKQFSRVSHAALSAGALRRDAGSGFQQATTWPGATRLCGRGWAQMAVRRGQRSE